MDYEDFDEDEYKNIAAIIDDTNIGLKGGMSRIIANIISFIDKEDISDEKGFFAASFLENEASELGQNLKEFTETLRKDIKAYFEWEDEFKKRVGDEENEANLSDEESQTLNLSYDSVTRGLRMGEAEIIGKILALDKGNLDDKEPCFFELFAQHQASEQEISLDEWMDIQTKALTEFYEWRDAINGIIRVSNDLGYKEPHKT